MGVVCRHEDHGRRHFLRLEPFQDAEAVQLGHRDVQEEDIRSLPQDRGDGGKAVGALRGDVHAECP